MPSFRIKVFILPFILVINFFAWSQDAENESRNLVVMRMIGHQILLDIGDTNSRVLPIKKIGDKYRIEFDTQFQFEPKKLASAIDSIISVEQMVSSYIVEVEQSATQEITYSYQFDSGAISTNLPCQSRAYPKDSYTVLITYLDRGHKEIMSCTEVMCEENESTSFFYWIFGGLGLTLFSLVIIRNRKRSKTLDSDEMKIGKYQFDKKKLILSCEDEVIDLTSKEADLLSMLYNSANDTIEREKILKVVWEDQGVYVGRTLDVFISKLRKKLEADSSVKILNIRGVGYRLVLDNK